ncbi:MAG: hypothetical protein QW568_01000 [Candidatus Anstonellaceae archaeon]
MQVIGKQATKTAKLLADQRTAERLKAFGDEARRHGMISRSSGAYFLGRDREGAAVETRSIAAFPIVVDKWYVQMGFKQEDADWLEGKSPKEIENALMKTGIPRKMKSFALHIIPAVRLLAHISESYDNEIRKTEIALGKLDKLNASLAEKKTHTDADIKEAIEKLREIGEGFLAFKRVAVKRIVAMERLEQTARMLDESLKLEGGKREMQVSRACAVFTALRNRLGQWRDRQIAGISEHNHRKEYALRALRDEWLLSQLARFAEIPEKIHGYLLADREKLRVLDEIRRLLKDGNKSGALECMEKHKALFRVSERERKGVEERIALMEEGRKPPEEKGRKSDYQIGHYAWLYIYARDGDLKNAERKLGELAVFVNANKPRFLLDELKKSNEPYLAGVVGALEEGVASFESQDFAIAKSHFTKARNLMRKIVNPTAKV